MWPFPIFSHASQPKIVQTDPGSDCTVSGYFFLNKNSREPCYARRIANGEAWSAGVLPRKPPSEYIMWTYVNWSLAMPAGALCFSADLLLRVAGTS